MSHQFSLTALSPYCLIAFRPAAWNQRRLCNYEVTTAIITLVLLGRVLEARARGRTSAAIKRLIGLQPRTARVVRHGAELDVPVHAVIKGDIVIVRPGERLPVDGDESDRHIQVPGAGIRPKAKRGRPLRIRLNRQEDGTCSDIVVFPDFGIRRDLPAFRTILVEFVPDRAGVFTFVCGMNMLRGKLIVSD